MPIRLETLAESASLPSAPASPSRYRIAPADWPVAVLALMIFMVPALGVPSELMLQDTLKSALVAFGVLIAALVFFWQQRNRTQPLLWHGLVWLPLVLMLYALGSMAWSHTYLAGVEAIRWFILSLLLWLGLNTFTRENLPLLLWGMHGGALVASVWAALQFWFDFGLFPQGPVPASTFINRNFFAEYAVTALPFSILLLANLRASRWLVLMAFTLALNVVALLMTGTRSALLALLVLLPVFALILIRHRQQFAFVTWSRGNQALVGLVLVVGVMGMGSIPSGNAKVIREGMGTTALQRSFLRAASMTEGKEYTERSFSIRATMWKATARMMIANPWTGVGAGAWEVQIPLYQRIGEGMETDYYAHNEFLQLLSEYGVVVGGLFIAVLFAYLLIAAGKTWRLQGTGLAEAPLRALTLASLLALLIVSNAGFAWRLAGTGALLALGLSIFAASDARLGVHEAFFSGAVRWKPGFSKAMLAGMLGCVVLTTYITHQAEEAERKIVGAIKLAFYMTHTRTLDSRSTTQLKTGLLQSLREGIAINAHYRRLTPMVADQLVASGDWVNAVWIWESMAASRPNVVALWSNLTSGYISLGQYSRTHQALQQLQRLQPDAPGTKVLEAILLSHTGHEAQAAKVITDCFDEGEYDPEIVQAGYVLGLAMHNWPLAIRSLEINIQTWPEQAAKSYFRLGEIYANADVHDEAKALAAFRAGLQSAPGHEVENFRRQVPEKYRASL